MSLDKCANILGLLGLLSCSSAWAGVITGTSGSLNGALVSSFAETNSSNQLTSFGFELSGAAVRNPGADEKSVLLTLPSQAALANILEMELDWNPQGHPPPGVYDVPHFDFHFYYIPDSVRTSIPANVNTPIGPQYLPAGYGQPQPTVPNMGSHAVDLTSPEFNGSKFTQTFIYGFYSGHETFVEPMATQAFLESLTGTQQFAIKQPSAYALPLFPTLVPTTVDYNYNNTTDTYSIALGNFIDITATPESGTFALVALPFALLMLLLRKRMPLH